MSSSAITAPLYLDPTKAADGSAAAPSFAFANSTSTGIYRVSANTLGVATAGVQRVVVDANGNVGVGTASPNSRLHVNAGANYGIFTLQAVNGTDIAFTSGSTTLSSIAVDSTAGTNPIMIFRNGGTNTERMRIDASGRLLINTTSTSIHNTTTTGFLYDAGNRWLSVNGQNEAALFTSQVAGGAVMRFYLSNTGEKGSISISAGGVAYNTASDYRLKEDVQPMAAALSKIAALKPCTYKWKSDGSEGEGFIAHELAEVCPAAVCGEKDAVNEDGSIKSQGIDPAKLVALLTAAIQELSAKVDAQAAEIAELKAK